MKASGFRRLLGLMKTNLKKASQSLAKVLRKGRQRLVLAESCTGGILASLLTEIPGISDLFCGSLVVYREESKRRWAGVRASTLSRKSAVSAEVAEELARGLLRNTPEATIAASVTGYLGPAGKKVGLAYVAVLIRGNPAAQVHELDLRLKPRSSRSAVEARLELRDLAAYSVLVAIQSALTSSSPKMKRSSN